MRVTLENELTTLELLLQREADLVLEALELTIRALSTQDDDLALHVINFDDEVDAVYMEIEHGVETLLARQTPVASDLRLVLAMLHINVHLERMADYCVTIAKLTTLTCDLNPDDALIKNFADMADQAAMMIRLALSSFNERNQEDAESLPRLDAFINLHNREVVSRVLDLGGGAATREWGMRMIIVSRCLERIGDHAVDIGERTAYLVSGESREFTDASN
ncbi:MAG: phosphate signaling complex protein PhoU [Thermoleophilia bacterium]|nr:phosphate signaling complex protein PhoU [Thermoleophilia bacterium]